MDEDLLKLFADCDCKDKNCIWKQLIGTDFLYDERYNDWTNYSDFEGQVPFEKVLDSAPKEVQTQLLFHLDLFTSKRITNE